MTRYCTVVSRRDCHKSVIRKSHNVFDEETCFVTWTPFPDSAWFFISDPLVPDLTIRGWCVQQDDSARSGFFPLKFHYLRFPDLKYFFYLTVNMAVASRSRVAIRLSSIFASVFPERHLKKVLFNANVIFSLSLQNSCYGKRKQQVWIVKKDGWT